MTKSISTKLALGVAALALAACSGETASTSADDTAKKAEMAATEAALCTTMGPQTPRDISSKAGLNTTMFDMAPASTTMNLCNIHSHTNAEHKGPGFEVFVNNTDNGGFACNGTADLTAARRFNSWAQRQARATRNLFARPRRSHGLSVRSVKSLTLRLWTLGPRAEMSSTRQKATAFVSW